MAVCTDVSGRLGHHVDETGSVVQVYVPPREVGEDDKVVVRWVLKQEGVECGGQGKDRGVEFALCMTHRANPSRKVILNERWDSLTNN